MNIICFIEILYSFIVLCLHNSYWLRMQRKSQFISHHEVSMSIKEKKEFIIFANGKCLPGVWALSPPFTRLAQLFCLLQSRFQNWISATYLFKSPFFIADTLHLALNGAASLACFLCIPYFTHWCSHYNLPKPQCRSIQEFKNTNHLACLYWHKHIFYTDSAKTRGEGATGQGEEALQQLLSEQLFTTHSYVLGWGCRTCPYLLFRMRAGQGFRCSCWNVMTPMHKAELWRRNINVPRTGI